VKNFKSNTNINGNLIEIHKVLKTLPFTFFFQLIVLVNLINKNVLEGVFYCCYPLSFSIYNIWELFYCLLCHYI